MADPTNTNKTIIPDFLVSDAAIAEIQDDKLPKKKDGPLFTVARPQDLLPYLDELEEIFMKRKTTNDDAKIVIAISYMDYQTKKLHYDIAKEARGNWVNFERSLKDCYPESVESGFGSLDTLDRIIAKYKYIALGQLERVRNYVREFKLEADKLMATEVATAGDPHAKIEPLLSNKAAVEAFLSAFHEEFRVTLTRIMPPPPPGRRMEDAYPISTYYEKAKENATMHVAMTGFRDPASRVTSTVVPTTTIVTTPASARYIPDQVTVKQEGDELSHKVMATLDRVETVLRTVVVPQSYSQGYPQQNPPSNGYDSNGQSGGHAFNSNAGPSRQQPRPNRDFDRPREYDRTRFENNRPRPSNFGRCFFCNSTEHMAYNCELQTEYQKVRRWIKKDDDGMFILRDGTLAPAGDENESRKAKIDKIAKERGWEKPTVKSVNFAGDDLYEDPFRVATNTAITVEDMMMQFALMKDSWDGMQAQLARFQKPDEDEGDSNDSQQGN
jgi:hypothetical protein